MSDSTPRLGLPDLPDTPELYADTVADAFARIDAFTDLYLKDQYVDTPPSSPADGDAYLTGGAPTGAWSGYAYKIATCRDGAWTLLAPFDGLRAYVATSGAFIVYCDGAWIDWNSMISAAESSIASAATCDIGAAGSLFVAVTGTTTVTSLGTAANKLRFVRFAGALTLTYNATSLILPGGANIATAAGDTAIFASDGSGNWRCRAYDRASGVPLNVSAVTGTGAMVLSASPTISGTLTAAAASFSSFLVNTAAHVISSTEKIAIVGADVAAGFQNNDASANPTIGIWNKATPGTINFVNFYSGGSATQVGSITTNGTITAYNTTSDARLKDVAMAQNDYRAAIRALWVGDFTWTQTGAPGFGVLAQQAYEVMPNHQGVTRPADEDGSWQASAEPFGQLALWGVKDLYVLIETLAARIEALEASHAAG